LFANLKNLRAGLASVGHQPGLLMSDSDCLQQVRRGEPAGAEAIFHRHGQAILHFAARMLGNQHEAEEISQEVFLKMIARADQYDGRAPLISWLLSIAANACRDQLRRRKRVSVLPISAAQEIPSPAPSAVSALLADEQRRVVEEALAELSEEQREALILARYHGLPYAEVARTLGISEGAVKTRIFRAVETLKARLVGDEAPSTESNQPWTAAKP
jgi:RNA polymerase sigma factor (sigma-70 family)